jgi:nucleotide-binding universal stress UspA family protein
MQSLTRILLPVNLESHFWKSIDYGARLASQSGAIAELFYVLPFDTDYEKPKAGEIHHNRMLSLVAMLTQRFAEADTDAGQVPGKPPVFVGVLHQGDSTTCILEYAEQMDHDAIVMGTGSSTGDGITERVVRSALCPVLVVSEEGSVDRYVDRYKSATLTATSRQR